MQTPGLFKKSPAFTFQQQPNLSSPDTHSNNPLFTCPLWTHTQIIRFLPVPSGHTLIMIIFGLFALRAFSWPPYTCQSRFYYQVTVHSCTAGASATVSKCLSTPEPSGQVSVHYCTAFICCSTFFAFKWVSVQFCTMLYFNNRIVNWSVSRCVSRWGN